MQQPPKRKRGRPVGTTEYGEKKTTKTHVFTPTAHAWLRQDQNKDKIESLARSQ